MEHDCNRITLLDVDNSNDHNCKVLYSINLLVLYWLPVADIVPTFAVNGYPTIIITATDRALERRHYSWVYQFIMRIFDF